MAIVCVDNVNACSYARIAAKSMRSARLAASTCKCRSKKGTALRGHPCFEILEADPRLGLFSWAAWLQKRTCKRLDVLGSKYYAVVWYSGSRSISW